MARLTESDLSRLKLKWAFGFPGATRSFAQPTVVGRRLFVGSQGERSIRSTPGADAQFGSSVRSRVVRSAIVVGQRTGGRAVYFGDAGASCTFRGSVVALDASMGKMLWKAFTVAEEPKPDATNAAGVQLMGPSAAAIWSAPTFDAATQGSTQRQAITTPTRLLRRQTPSSGLTPAPASWRGRIR
jgi:polyvinyl alcohol dehydrogenase (cytochrome)